MTPTTAVELDFADGTYLFDLKLPQMAELQDKCGAIFALYGRVLKGRGLFEGVPVGLTWEGEAFDRDLFETIRLGLIGGGEGMVDDQPVKVSPILAKKLVERYCHTQPLRESWALAAAILTARIEGFEPPAEKKSDPTSEPETASTSDAP